MIPQLLFGHFMADYPGQTNWIFARKIQGWPGLLLHGGVVLVAQSAAVFPHTLRLAPIIIGMTVVHTVQDFLKIRYGDRVLRHPLVSYFADQALHVLLIILASPRLISIVGEQPYSVKLTGVLFTGLVLVTWTYYITYRTIVGIAEPYPIEWRWPGKVERALAYSVALFTFWWLAPLAVVVRLAVARWRGVSLRGETRFWVDAAIGIAVSAALGFLVINVVPV